MRKRVFLRRAGGEVVSRWAALGMIVAVLALVMSSFSIAPVASANPSETSTTSSPSQTAESPAPTTKAPTAPTSESPATTTKAPAASTSESPATTTKAPSESTSKAPATTSAAPTTTAKRAAAAVTPRGLNPDIEVKITEISVVGKPGEQIKVGDSVTVKGTWDARSTTPKEGDEFSIEFPAELKFPADQPIALKGKLDDDTEIIWGNCLLVAATNLMSCALTGEVASAPLDVYGDFEVFTKAVANTTSETVNFKINNEVVAVDLPGSGGIGGGTPIGEAKKSGKLQANKQSVRWTIDIPGSELAALPGGDTGSVILTDMLSANMELCADARLDAKLLSGPPGDLKPVANGVSVEQEGGAGTPVSIVIDNREAFKSNMLYRIEYTSCTESGVVDPEGTVYTNSVDIGGKDVASPGVGQDWIPETVPSKSGSLDKNKRYMEAAWTIMVPGTVIATNGHKIDIEDTLGGDHAVCKDGLQLSVAKSDYLPGRDGSNNDRTPVTGDFNIDITEQAEKSFSVTISPKDVDAFDAEQYYYVTYRSCLTTDEIPDNEVEFSNSATVNGSPVTITAKGPEFKGSKSGALNKTPRMVAGEEQPAGTTLDWKVQIPGRHLEGLTEPAVITDTFSDTMTVCEVGKDLKANLNLRVVAKDFLGNNSENPERDLTAATDVVRTADGIEITLPQETGDYNREIRYYIEYTLCTASGGLDQFGTKYENSLTYAGQKTVTESIEQVWGGGGTGTGVTRGSFSLLKEVAPLSKDFPEDTEFTVKVEEFAPGNDPAGNKPNSTYNIKVKADGTPVNGYNPRGTGWQIRLSEIDLPTVGGVYFEPGKFRPATGVTLNEDQTQALVTITPKSNVGVTLVNKAVLGKATITKTVIGDGLGDLTGNEKFVIKAQIDDDDPATGAEVREFTLEKDQYFELTDLPIGAKVTFTEVLPLNTDRVTWAEPKIEPKTLTIGKDAAANKVSVTNEAKITYGSFDLKKTVTGPEAFNKAVPATFDVLATWTDTNGAEQSKTLELPKDGSPVSFGENLPGGTKVTLTEMVPANGNGLAWGVPAYSGNVTIDDDGNAVVTIGKERGQVEVKNVVDTNDGTLRITKQVSGEAAGAIGDEEFTVEAHWRDGTNYVTKDLTVKQGESTSLGVDLPVGTEVIFTETGRPVVDGVEWGKTSWGTTPIGGSWLKDNGNGTAKGLVSDDPTDGRLITLTNEALWKNGSVEFTKFIVDGEDLIPATEADLPEGAEFEVRITGINPALPEGTEFPAVGETKTLNAENGFTWNSGDVLPRGTVITFEEVDPAPLPGFDWERPSYYVAADAGDAEYRDTVTIEADAEAVVEIHNTPIPTTDVDIAKIVTGPKGKQVTEHESTTFQVTATWKGVEDEERTCILDVKPGGSVTPTADCDATVIDGRVYFPLGTEITFAETGAYTDVTNVKWGEVVWSVKEGDAEVATSDIAPTAVTVTLTGEANEPVVLGLENKTSSNGLIIIPLPIPLPPFDGSWIPSWPGSEGPTPPVSGQPGQPGGPGTPATPGDSGHSGAPGKPAPGKPVAQPDQSPSLPVTGANVVWLAVAALALIGGGAWLTLRNRKRVPGTE